MRGQGLDKLRVGTPRSVETDAGQGATGLRWRHGMGHNPSGVHLVQTRSWQLRRDAVVDRPPRAALQCLVGLPELPQQAPQTARPSGSLPIVILLECECEVHRVESEQAQIWHDAAQGEPQSTCGAVAAE